MTVSGEQRRAQSYIYTYLSFPQTPVPPRLPRNIKQSSQCYTVSPCWLSTLNTCVYISQRRRWHPIPVLLPGESHGQRSLVGCRPWGRKEWDTTERLNFHFSLSCIGEGNGNPLQCSCLENPRTGEPGGLPSMGSHRFGHDWRDLEAAAAARVHFNLKLPIHTFYLPLGNRKFVL